LTQFFQKAHRLEDPMAHHLGSLADARKHNERINIEDREIPQLLRMWKSMLRIRLAEQQLAQRRSEGIIGGPVHLGAGQEAIAVGVSEHLRKTDKVFGAHRSHAHMLALGSTCHGLFAEVLGKATGVSRGMGGSMHLWDASNGFHGAVPIVAGTVPIAVGAGVAAKLQKTDAVSVCYLGDGAVEEGAVHESLNLARVLNAQVVFVVENNLFASHMHINLRQPNNCTARFATANDIPAAIVDGNNVLEVSDAAQKLIQEARTGGGPGFLEAVTYRWYGHVDWRDDIDVGVSRSKQDLDSWKARDPIARLRQAMQAKQVWPAAECDAIEKSLQEEMASAWAEAMQDPFPDVDALMNCVYAQR
jgi:TPP-dependent pyruvate/acetoin dehydrogenase alpha subunit